MTMKRKRAKKAREITKKTGIKYGASIRLVKALDSNGLWFAQFVDGVIVDAPTFCDCCGPEYEHAKVGGPKGFIPIGDCIL